MLNKAIKVENLISEEAVNVFDKHCDVIHLGDKLTSNANIVLANLNNILDNFSDEKGLAGRKTITVDDIDIAKLDLSKVFSNYKGIYAPGVWDENIAEDLAVKLNEDFDQLTKLPGKIKSRKVKVLTILLNTKAPNIYSPRSAFFNVEGVKLAEINNDATIMHISAMNLTDHSNVVMEAPKFVKMRYQSGNTDVFNNVGMKGIQNGTGFEIIFDCEGNGLLIFAYEEPNTDQTDLVTLHIFNRMIYLIKITADVEKNMLINERVESEQTQDALLGIPTEVGYSNENAFTINI
jgi:hypothetical protein